MKINFKQKTLVKITPRELLSAAEDQIQFLKDFCYMYDNYNKKYGSLIATRLRVLLYDTKVCNSVYKQLYDIFQFYQPLFMDSRNVKELHFANEKHCNYVSSFMCQYELKHYPDSEPILMPLPKLQKENCYLSFEQWWKEATILQWENNIITRAKAVSMIANQDGGAHVSKEILENMAMLKRGFAPTVKIKISTDGVDKIYTAQSDLILYAIIRTIAKETLIAFEENIIPICTKIYYENILNNTSQ